MSKNVTLHIRAWLKACFLFVYACAYATGPSVYTSRTECESALQTLRATNPTVTFPDFYCDCYMDCLPFYYGMDTTIMYTNWFTATLNDVQRGFSTYWFSESNSGITVDGFVTCAQNTPTISQHVGANRSFHADLQTLLRKFGQSSIGTLGEVPMYVRVTMDKQAVTNDGRIIITPYDKGPHSTCDNPLPLYPGNPYVISDTDNVYALPPTQACAYKDTAVQVMRWVCPHGDSAEVRVTYGACSGPEVFRGVLRDSLHVLQMPDSVLERCYATRNSKIKKDSLFFHVHTTAPLGEFWYLRNAKLVCDTAYESQCKGKSLVVNTMSYSSDTAFADTVFLDFDSLTYRYRLQVSRHELQFLAPELEYDTLQRYADQLPFSYLRTTINTFGDYAIYYRVAGKCDRDVRLHVEEILRPDTIYVDTTLCQGRRLRIDGVNYTSDATFSVTKSNGIKDVVTIYTLHFTAPELTYDTISCHQDSLPFNYRGNAKCKITAFGDKTFTITDPSYQNCAEKVQVTVIQLWYEQRNDIDTTICQGKSFVMEGTEVLSGDTLFYHEWRDKKTIFHDYYHVTYAEPTVENDTLRLTKLRLPYDYQGVEITHFGDTLLYFVAPEECSRLVALCVDSLAIPVVEQYASVDTTICEGVVFELHDRLFTESSLFVDTFWLNEYTVLYTTCTLTVVPIAYQNDTLHVLASSLPLTYQGYEIASFGTDTLHFVTELGCDRYVYLFVEEKPVVYDTLYVDTVLCQGKWYSVEDTLLTESASFCRVHWSAGLDTCTTMFYSASFIPQPAVIDTAYAFYSELPYMYEGYPGGRRIKSFGQFTFRTTPNNDCWQSFQFTLLQKWAVDTTQIDSTVCAGGTELHYSVQTPTDKSKADSVHLIIYNIEVAAPEELYDTLLVTQLPVSYMRRTYTEVGDYNLTITSADGCKQTLHFHLAYNAPDALEDLQGQRTGGARKVLLDGKLFILYDDELFDMTGRKIDTNKTTLYK